MGTSNYFLTEKEVIIKEIDNEFYQISVPINWTIKKLEIIDVLGRTIYISIGTGSSVIYEVSKLSNSIYLMKVTLQNGGVVIKKAIKK